jgi:hypothetical protein
MAMRIEPIPDLPALLMHQVGGDFDETDLANYKAACYALYQREQRHIYVVYDIRQLEVNFSQLVMMLPMFQRQPHRLTDLPLTINIVIDSTNPVVMIGVRAVQTGQYGKMDVKVVNSVDEALRAIRQRVNAQSGGTVAS